MHLPVPIDPEVQAQVERADITFNRYGIDPFGVEREALARAYSMLKWPYRNYFTVRAVGIERVPDEGPVMLVGNHTGGLPVDGAMVAASMMLDRERPRVVHAMVEKFVQSLPFVGTLFNRAGHLTGLPEHAVRLLEAGRVLMVFPEGARGTGKLYKEQYELVRFGTGFMRLALQTGSPIVPFAFIGGVEALPTIYHSRLLARLTGAPYFPVTPYLVPIPRPWPCQVHYGEPMHFEGDGTETDEVILGYVEQVRDRIRELIRQGLAARDARQSWKG